MELDEIKKKWHRSNRGDLSESISAWDSVADDYVYSKKVSFENDDFLKFVASKISITPEMRVLDVGCGAGAYTMALATEVKEAVGVDFSPKMIAAAKQSALVAGIENVSFLERDWYSCSAEEFCGKYDIVFAHTTPAVLDYDTLLKMIKASKKYCFLCKPARRTDEVFDALKRLIGIEETGNDASIAYTFDAIWGNGFHPEISYRKTIWKSEKTLDKAESWYIGRLKGLHNVGEAEVEKIKNYLREISEENVVKETTHTTLVDFFWEVKK